MIRFSKFAYMFHIVFSSCCFLLYNIWSWIKILSDNSFIKISYLIKRYIDDSQALLFENKDIRMILKCVTVTQTAVLI